MKISQTINTIKAIQINFINIISSNSMQFTLNSFHFMSYFFFIKQSIKKLFMSFSLKTFLLTAFAFLIFSPSTSIKE